MKRFEMIIVNAGNENVQNRIGIVTLTACLVWSIPR